MYASIAVSAWSIGEYEGLPIDASDDIYELYYKLERVILPLFYATPHSATLEVRPSAIALNGSLFTTQRMVMQYPPHRIPARISTDHPASDDLRSLVLEADSRAR
jgi:hypothetical protein